MSQLDDIGLDYFWPETAPSKEELLDEFQVFKSRNYHMAPGRNRDSVAIGQVTLSFLPSYIESIVGLDTALQEQAGNCFSRSLFASYTALEALSMAVAVRVFKTGAKDGKDPGYHADMLFKKGSLDWTTCDTSLNLHSRAKDDLVDWLYKDARDQFPVCRVSYDGAYTYGVSEPAKLRDPVDQDQNHTTYFLGRNGLKLFFAACELIEARKANDRPAYQQLKANYSELPIPRL